MAPRPGLEPGTCGLTERRADFQYSPLDHVLTLFARVLFCARYAELLPLTLRCERRIEPSAPTVRPGSAHCTLHLIRTLGPTASGPEAVKAVAEIGAPKRSPISGPVSRGSTNSSQPQRRGHISKAQLPAIRVSADSNRIRFLALLAANRIAPVTHQVQACRDVLRLPWRR